MRLTRSRRTAAGAAFLTTAALVLTACGSGGGGSEGGGGDDGDSDFSGQSLTVLWGANSNLAEEQQDWFDTISADFEEETGADVTFETYASSSDELTRIQTSVVSGQGPDVYTLGTTFTPLAVSTGAFVTMTDDTWDAVGGIDRFNPATLAMSGPEDGELTGIPYVSRPFVMAYNTRIFSEAGITETPTTWDEFAEVGRQLTTGDVYGAAIAYADSFDPWKFVWAMAVQQGNPVVEDGQAMIDDPAFQTAFETYFGWLTEDEMVDPSSVGWTNSQALGAFAEGRAAMIPMTSSSSLTTLEASAVADEFAYAILPTVAPGYTENPDGGVPAASIISGDNVVVADYSPNQDLAFAFVEYVTRPEVQLDYFERFGDLPANADALTEATSSTDVLGPVGVAAEQSFGTPFVGAWPDIQNALTNVAAQAQPVLAEGNLTSDYIASELAAAQQTAQDALDRESSAG